MDQARSGSQEIVPEKRTYTVDEIASILNIGRNTAYALVKSAQFKVLRIGNTIRIPKRSFDEWLDSSAE